MKSHNKTPEVIPPETQCDPTRTHLPTWLIKFLAVLIIAFMVFHAIHAMANMLSGMSMAAGENISGYAVVAGSAHG